MTEQEAINELVDYVGDVFKTTISFEATTMARKALEKQIAKKVMMRGYAFLCPVCGKSTLNGIGLRSDYCPKCGQKLYWD